MSAAVVPAPVPAVSTAHSSFLKKIGHLSIQFVTKLLPQIISGAHAAEPLVDLLFPLQGPLFNSVVDAVVLVEVDAVQAAAGQTTGAAKFEAVLAKVGPDLAKVAAAHGLLGADAAAAIQRYVQAVFDLLDGPAK